MIFINLNQGVPLMTNKDKILFIIGIILLIAGVLLSIINIGDDNATLAQQANNAYEAAQAISTNNQHAALLNAISLFLLGLGTVLVGVFALKFLTKKK